MQMHHISPSHNYNIRIFNCFTDQFFKFNFQQYIYEIVDI